MGVLMQAFYWNSPIEENKVSGWWNEIKNKLPSLKETGFTALWLPPANKAANIGDNLSMGYDPYDYYDLGDFDQKGSIKTLYGSKMELIELVETAHQYQLQVYADLVLNHNSGADAEELNPIDQQMRWTKFEPASRKFSRSWECFHPSLYETWDNGVFGGMPDLCHRNPYVYTEMLEYARWLLEDIGFDGFRYDCVKGYGAWMVRAIQELRAIRNDAGYKPFGVGECWDSERTIDEWLEEANAWSDNPASAFDFPLRSKLKQLCDEFNFPLSSLAEPDTVVAKNPLLSVTFVDNHDTHPPHEDADPIINDKMLAYSFILTHEGYPCVFWQDYYNFRLAGENTVNGIARLVQLHESHAGGNTQVLYASHDLYIIQRTGGGDKPGLIYVLNNRGDDWQGQWIKTVWSDTMLKPAAWWSDIDLNQPDWKVTNHEGWVNCWAPPRGYAVYVPG